MSAALKPARTMSTSRITLAVLVIVIQTSQNLAVDDSMFTLMNRATGFCLVKRTTRQSRISCLDVRWTTGDRLFVVSNKKCLGVQGKSLGSEVNQYDCDDKSDLQKWECRNETLLALKGTQFLMEVQLDETIALSRTVGPNNQFTITGTNMGACRRTYRELYTIDGNANGQICRFPFMYKDRWYGDCTTFDSSVKRLWCATETKYEHELWGYCPSTSTDYWVKNVITGAYYQLNTQSALTWQQADQSCKQQSASLVSITDPNEQAFISALGGRGRQRLWMGLFLNLEHGWKWSDGKPFRYLRWNPGNPLPDPGHSCAFLDSAGQSSWQSSLCSKKLGYICYKAGAPPIPPQIEQGFCSSPWIPYNGHCFELKRTPKTWSDAQKECRKESGDLVSIRNVEDQSFVISQLGYASTDELWIGLNDVRTEGLFDWSDHSAVLFTSWEYGKPSVSTDTDDCVLLRGENGNWADRLCDEKHGFLCMKQSETERTGPEIDLDLGCKAGWKKHGSYCYFVGTERKTFDEANDDCKSSDSYLADVSTGVDNAFLVSLVGMRSERYFWLGLSNQKNIDEFVWTNSRTVRFTHWNTAMPGNIQGCIAMTSGIFAGLWDVLPCTNTEKYICKHLAEGEILTPVPPTPVAPNCEDGWTRLGTRNLCAKFFTGPRSDEKTWYEARDYCRAIGGDLLSLHGANELLTGGRYGKGWIGLHSPDQGTGYVWSDGTSVNYQHWRDGEPNNHNNDESCVELQLDKLHDVGSWNDMNCEGFNDWLCQIRSGMTPKPTPTTPPLDYNTTVDGWLVWRGNQYLIQRRAMSMEDASQYCQQRHGKLASISSKEENIFLWKQVSRSYGAYYIGLSVDLDGSFWWMDGSSVSFQRWDEDQPNSNSFDENCVTMHYYMGFWRTCNCGQEHMFICKRGASAPTNTTVAPTVAPKGGCPSNWIKFESKCYSINSRRTTWEDSRRQCVNIGGSLVSIPTRRVQAFLITKISEVASTDLWIGLNSLKQDGFYWADGKKREYTNWGYSKNRHRPGSFYQRWDEQDCVMMTTNPNQGIGKWLIKSCNDTNGFICLRDLDPNIKPQPEMTIPDTYVTLGNDSIKVVTRNLTWEDAKKDCKKDNANLASLRNEWTQAYVELLAINLKGPLWIGLNKNQTGGTFRYIDGFHLKFSTWAPTEPRRDRPCVYMDVDGKWKTDFCNRTMNAVCIQSSDVPPTESTVYPGTCRDDTEGDYQQTSSWIPFKGHCYLFITYEIEWADAASSCVRHGGTLASIEDTSEQEFVESHLELFRDSHSSFWIGLYKTHAGTWKWLDKTVLDFVKWAVDEPDNDEYGEIETSDGTWRTGRRWHDRAYICKSAKIMPGESDPKSEPQTRKDPRSRVHTSLVVVLAITIVSTLMVTGFLLYKRSSKPLPTFDNPLYFDSERTQPDVVDTNKLIENAEEEHSDPIITL